jgi:glycosyltransferase involved in cell wall biosynthesis
MAFKRADFILFKSDSDREIAIAQLAVAREKCLIVPYGTELITPVEKPAWQQAVKRDLQILPEKKMILFAGSFDYSPNREALRVITDEIIPRLKEQGFPFRLAIAGTMDEAQRHLLNLERTVVATGFVDCIEPFFRGADVFINPVVHGSGIQTKNLDAIANGCNVVCTEFAGKGMPDFLIDTKLLLAPNNNWDQFCSTIIRASQQLPSTPQRFYDEYHWENIIAKMLKETRNEGG